MILYFTGEYIRYRTKKAFNDIVTRYRHYHPIKILEYE